MTNMRLKDMDLSITDYLLKPYSFERFLQAVEKARKNLTHFADNISIPYIFIKTAYRLEKIYLNEIIFVEGKRDYRCIHTLSKKIMTLQTFGQFEQQVPNHQLCRVHKSYMVSLEKIDAIEKDEIRIGSQFIPISEKYKKSFFARIVNPGKK